MSSGVTGATPPPPARAVHPRRDWSALISPWLWAGAAIIILAALLVWPVINTIVESFQNDVSSQFVGLKNYQFIFTSPSMLEILRNNLLWLVLGTLATVGLGLIIAVLADRARFEKYTKATIFIPMAISMVGASVIWNFMYKYAPPGTTQTGLLNAIWTKLGGAPIAFISTPGLNNFAIIAAYVWIWTGFCMVILSAALKGIPDDVLEAARVDGATELQIFWSIIVPMISPTIAVVATTMVINILKIFDIIYVMSGGNFGTNVIAVAYYQQLFTFGNNGIAAALAVILLIVIVPVMLVNINRFRAQEATR
jgi:alpha-glucoside transport system permease protein